jgi:hypothetical protein
MYAPQHNFAVSSDALLIRGILWKLLPQLLLLASRLDIEQCRKCVTESKERVGKERPADRSQNKACVDGVTHQSVRPRLYEACTSFRVRERGEIMPKDNDAEGRQSYAENDEQHSRPQGRLA